MEDEFDEYPGEELGDIVLVSSRYITIKRVDHWYIYDHVKACFIRDFRGTERGFKNERLARQLADFLNTKES